MDIGLPYKLERGGAFVKDLGGKAGGQEIVCERGGEATIVFDDDHQWLLLGAHAESGGGKTRGNHICKKSLEVAKPH
jgi:hypothetical protein